MKKNKIKIINQSLFRKIIYIDEYQTYLILKKKVLSWSLIDTYVSKELFRGSKKNIIIYIVNNEKNISGLRYKPNKEHKNIKQENHQKISQEGTIFIKNNLESRSFIVKIIILILLFLIISIFIIFFLKVK